MPSIDEIRKNLQSYKAVLRRQGDFTIYASKYIEDVEALLASTTKPKTTGVTVRKQKFSSGTEDSKD